MVGIQVRVDANKQVKREGVQGSYPSFPARDIRTSASPRTSLAGRRNNQLCRRRACVPPDSRQSCLTCITSIVPSSTSYPTATSP